MRFRTRIAHVALLHKIVRSLAALAKVCVIRLSEEKVHFIIPGNEGKDGVQVWSQVKVPTLFDHYRIESNANNEIWLEINLDAFLKVLKSADTTSGSAGDNPRQNATSLTDSDVMLKLNKRDSRAIWAFDIKGKNQSGHMMHITHEVAVHIITSRRQSELNEPLCPPPDIHLVLPNLAELKVIVSRLSHLSDNVAISANHEGTMELRVKSTSLQMSTTWTNLAIPNSIGDESETEAPPKDHMFTTNVSIRGFQKFLTSHHVGGDAIACICEKHCLIAYVYIGDIREAGGVLTFFIPDRMAE
ncbi:Checkpoint protein hus1 [Vanrija albida]|uniref:Checkpoint protein n=1 Tax=Vanrija albida TaxID=181172 RepID=A0ABR3Q2Q4_9TREE